MSLFSPGDIVAVNFPGVTGVKRRPAVVLSEELVIERDDGLPNETVGKVDSEKRNIENKGLFSRKFMQSGVFRRNELLHRSTGASSPIHGSLFLNGGAHERDHHHPFR